MIEQTLTIIKPNAVNKGLAGKILSMWEEAGFEIVAIKKVRLTREQARGFYQEHEDEGFFSSLLDFMTSGPCFVLVLQKEDAIRANRDLMGKTDPADAAMGTIRKLYGESLQNNSVHGSDKPSSAAREISYFFNVFELTAA